MDGQPSVRFGAAQRAEPRDRGASDALQALREVGRGSPPRIPGAMLPAMKRALSPPATTRAVFARHARAALEKYLSESRTGGAAWNIGANLAAVRWCRDDGIWMHAALRRHLDWVTGEAGVSREPVAIGSLTPVTALPPPGVTGFRIRLGTILHGEDRWWPAGGSTSALVERLEWLALQLAVKSGPFLRRWPGTKP